MEGGGTDENTDKVHKYQNKNRKVARQIRWKRKKMKHEKMLTLVK